MPSRKARSTGSAPSRLPARREPEKVAGYTYDQEAADIVIDFLESVCCHTKDSPTAKAGEPMQLLEWHKRDVIEPLYGWRTEDGLRRYRLAYLEVPKKNGVLAPAA
jgi:phage terminase large subunit-like protein